MIRRCLILAALLATSACQRTHDANLQSLGDPKLGLIMITREGCGSCHEIPGVVDADGEAGPPLTHFARRTLIAGVLPNTPSNLVLWLKTPQSVVPENAMPNMGLSDAQAKDVAAYLYTIK